MIDDPTDPAHRLRKIRDGLAEKGRLLAARRQYIDGNGRITPQDEERALIAAGVRDPRPSEDQAQLAKLRAGIKYGLTADQAEGMAAVTPEAAEAEAARIAAVPGDGGVRTDQPALTNSGLDNLKRQIAEAEQAKDFDTAGRLKVSLLGELRNQ